MESSQITKCTHEISGINPAFPRKNDNLDLIGLDCLVFIYLV